MAVATIKGGQFTALAEHLHETQKTDFTDSLEAQINKSIELGMTQYKNGECMNFDEFKNKFIKEHSLDGKV